MPKSAQNHEHEEDGPTAGRRQTHEGQGLHNPASHSRGRPEKTQAHDSENR